MLWARDVLEAMRRTRCGGAAGEASLRGQL